MASTTVQIPNMRDAVRDGTVPGAFSADRTTFEFPTLAHVGARGATHLWTIRVRLIDGDEYVPITDAMLDRPSPALAGRAEITVESQQEGGKIRDVVPTYVTAGKNLGRSNATNQVSQAFRDAFGLFNKQKKRAGTSAVVKVSEHSPAVDAVASTSAAAPSTVTGAPSSAEPYDRRPPPQLVKKIGDTKDATFTDATFRDGVTLQRKYNGVRYVTYFDAGAPVAYSRTSSTYPGQAQLTGELTALFAAAPPLAAGRYGLTEATAALYAAPDPHLDGELYKHGKPLNWISGQARKSDDEGLLEYHVYDVFFPGAIAAGHDMPSRYRQEYLRDFLAAGAHAHVHGVENFPAASLDEAKALAKRFLTEGYEGAIARKDGAGYRYSFNGYHSANLVKIKPIFDAEFPVVGFTQGTRGKDVGAVIWICEVPNAPNPRDKTFNVVPKDMSYADRYKLFACLGEVGADGRTRFDRDLRGLQLTVEYPELSAATGKPVQAKATVFRTYEGGPENDPVRKLFESCGLGCE